MIIPNRINSGLRSLKSVKDNITPQKVVKFITSPSTIASVKLVIAVIGVFQAYNDYTSTKNTIGFKIR